MSTRYVSNHAWYVSFGMGKGSITICVGRMKIFDRITGSAGSTG